MKALRSSLLRGKKSATAPFHTTHNLARKRRAAAMESSNYNAWSNEQLIKRVTELEAQLKRANERLVAGHLRDTEITRARWCFNM